jgi:hypothetical protein
VPNFILQAIAEYGATAGQAAAGARGSLEQQFYDVWQSAMEEPLIPIVVILSALVVIGLFRTRTYRS